MDQALYAKAAEIAWKTQRQIWSHHSQTRNFPHNMQCIINPRLQISRCWFARPLHQGRTHCRGFNQKSAWGENVHSLSTSLDMRHSVTGGDQVHSLDRVNNWWKHQRSGRFLSYERQRTCWKYVPWQVWKHIATFWHRRMTESVEKVPWVPTSWQWQTVSLLDVIHWHAVLLALLCGAGKVTGIYTCLQ